MTRELPIILRDKNNYEKIICEKTIDTGERYFLIKIKDKPYQESLWVPSKIFFKEKLDESVKQEDIFPKFDKDHPFNPDFSVVQTILNFSRGVYRVKWTGLPLEDSTLQKYISAKDFSVYNQRKKASFTCFTKSKKKKKSLLLSSETRKFNDIDAITTDINTNFLVQSYNSGIDPIIHVTKGTFDYSIFDKFCMELYTGYNEAGPFLVFTTQEKAEYYCKLLNENKNLTTLAYYGSEKSLEIADEFCFCNDKKCYKFHYLIVTEDSYMKREELINSVHFAVALYTENTTIKEKIRSKFNIFLKEEDFIHESKTNIELCQLLLEFGDKKETNKIEETLDCLLPYIKNKNTVIRRSLNDKIINCPLSKNQKHAALKVINKNINKNSFSDILSSLLLVAQHPFLIPGEEECFPSGSLKEASTKFKVCYELLNNSLEKTCIVVDTDELIVLIEEFLVEENIAKEKVFITKEINIPKNINNFIVFGCCKFNTNPESVVTRLICSECLEDKQEKFDEEFICKAFWMAATNNTREKTPQELIEAGKTDTKRYVKLISSIDNNGFWKEAIEATFKDEPRVYKKDLTPRELNSTIKEFLNYKWGKWSDIKSNLKYKISVSELRILICSVIFKVCETIYPDIDDSEFSILLRTITKYRDNSIKLPSTIQLAPLIKTRLPYIQSQMISYGIDEKTLLGEIKLPEKPARWWSLSYDAALIDGINLYGFNINAFEQDKDSFIQTIYNSKFLHQGLIKRYDAISMMIGNLILSSEDISYAILDDSLKDKITPKDANALFLNLKATGTTKFFEEKINKEIKKSMVDNAIHFASKITCSQLLRKCIESIKIYTRSTMISNYSDIETIIKENPWSDYQDEENELRMYESIMEAGVTEMKKFKIVKKRYETKRRIVYKRIAFLSRIIEKLNKEKEEEKQRELKLMKEQEEALKKEKKKEKETSIKKNKSEKRKRNKIIIKMDKLEDISENEEGDALIELPTSPLSSTYSSQELFSSPVSDHSQRVMDMPNDDDFDIFGDELDMEGDIDKFEEEDIEEEEEEEEEEEKLLTEKRPKLQIQNITKTIPVLSKIQFPIRISEFTNLISPGEIVFDREGFHTERYLFPKGYTATRLWRSVNKVDEKVVWKCEIIDNGEKYPVFRVSAKGEGVFEGNTPIQPWNLINKKIDELNGVKGNDAVLSGVEMFLLSNKVVNGIIQQLPNVDKCGKYLMRNIHNEARSITIVPVINPAKKHRKHHHHHHHHHSHKKIE